MCVCVCVCFVTVNLPSPVKISSRKTTAFTYYLTLNNTRLANNSISGWKHYNYDPVWKSIWPIFVEFILCTHTRTHARTHAHTHARTHARTRTHTHTHTNTHTRTHARIHTHANTRPLPPPPETPKATRKTNCPKYGGCDHVRWQASQEDRLAEICSGEVTFDQLR